MGIRLLNHAGNILPGVSQGFDTMVEKTLTRRLTAFVLIFGVTLFVIYGLLPWLTHSIAPLSRMSQSLHETGIDPSRYYYTDVEQVKESEQYLRRALNP